MFGAFQSAFRELAFMPKGGDALRPTSQIRVKVHDHCNVRALIVQKDRDRRSSLHIRRRGPKRSKEKFGDEKSTWSSTWESMDMGARFDKICARPTSKR